MPIRHYGQPEAAPISLGSRRDTQTEFWHSLLSALGSCTSQLGSHIRLAQTISTQEPVVRGLTISRVTMQQRSRELDDKVVRYKSLDGGGPDLDKFKRICRVQEDKLRQLRSKTLRHLVEKPSDADADYEPGLTYYAHVVQTLRNAVEKCDKAAAEFMRAVEKAVAMGTIEKEGNQGEVKPVKGATSNSCSYAS